MTNRAWSTFKLICGILALPVFLLVLSVSLIYIDTCFINPPRIQGGIPYEIVEQWRHGSIIVIDPKFRNEKDMRKLRDILVLDTANWGSAFVFIYDDKWAASLRWKAQGKKLSKNAMAHHDAHLIGEYIRNSSTGVHRLDIMLDGASGERVTIQP